MLLWGLEELWRVKLKKKMTTKDSKSYLGCLNKLVDQYDNLYYHSAYKKPVDTD